MFNSLIRDEISPKLMAIVEIIRESAYIPEFSGIIFVKTRRTTNIMVRALEQMDALKNWIRFNIIITFKVNSPDVKYDIEDHTCLLDTPKRTNSK
jgi:hypothetical protein